MANGKDVKTPDAPLAYHDFYKTNGLPRSAFEFHTEGPSLTRQEMADECDINNIMKRYDAYLADPMRKVLEPRYVDLTEAPDTLLGFMRVMKEGEEAFMRLPADVRKEFDNDPMAFVDFAANPENIDQMREWGLAEPEKAPEAPMRVEVVNPAPQDNGPAGGPAKPAAGTLST